MHFRVAGNDCVFAGFADEVKRLVKRRRAVKPFSPQRMHRRGGHMVARAATKRPTLRRYDHPRSGAASNPVVLYSLAGDLKSYSDFRILRFRPAFSCVG